MSFKSLRAALMLLIGAVIWGAAVSFQSMGMDHVGPFTFQAARFLVGGIVLVPAVRVLGRNDPGKESADYKPNGYWLGGAVCGVFLMVACALQQFGVMYTSVGKVGFLTSLYIIFIPIFGVFLNKKIGLNIWVSVVLAMVGMYLLCMKGAFTLSKGDTFVLLGAIGFTFQIMAVDKYAALYNGLKLSCVQFFTAGILFSVMTLIFEKPSMAELLSAWLPILYTGVVSCGIGYTFQVLAQKDLRPAMASIIMSLESVFSVIFGWIILGQSMTNREILGCVIMFAAIIIAQVFEKEDKAAER